MIMLPGPSPNSQLVIATTGRRHGPGNTCSHAWKRLRANARLGCSGLVETLAEIHNE